MQEYFSKQNEGGAISSRGFFYQDLCAVKTYMKAIGEDDFKCLTTETLDDFTLLFNGKPEKLCQVKINKVSSAKLNSILENVADLSKDYSIISQDFSDDVKNIICKKQELETAKRCGRSESEINTIELEFQRLVRSNGVKFDLPSNIDFEETSDINDLEVIILYSISRWCKEQSIDADEETILKLLIADIQKARCNRSYISRSNIEEAAHSSMPVKPKYMGIQEIEYDEYIIRQLKDLSSKYLSIKPTTETIIAYITNSDYENAYQKIIKLGEGERSILEDVIIWLEIKLNKLRKAKVRCDELQKKKHFENVAERNIYYYKGIIYTKEKNYSKAFNYLKRCRSMYEDQQLFYDLSFNLAKCETILKRDLKDAADLLKHCSAMHEGADLLWLEYYNPYFIDKPEILQKIIEINNDDKAHLYLADFYRCSGWNSLAVQEYHHYFKEFSSCDNWESLLGFINCLYQEGSYDQAQLYYTIFVDKYLTFNHKKIKDHSYSIFVNIGWNSTMIITCLKKNNNFYFESPFGSDTHPEKAYLCGNQGHVYIGTQFNRFAHVYIMMAESNREEPDWDHMTKAVLIKNYSSAFSFQKAKDYLERNFALNHEYSFDVSDETLQILGGLEGVKPGDKILFKEYLAEEDVSIKMYEGKENVSVNSKIKEMINSDMFYKGDGFYKYKKSIKNGNEASVIFYSIEGKQLIELQIPPECIDFKEAF